MTIIFFQVLNIRSVLTGVSHYNLTTTMFFKYILQKPIINSTSVIRNFSIFKKSTNPVVINNVINTKQSYRSFFSFFRKPVTPQTLLQRDNIPNGFKLIYRSQMETYILFGQFISITTIITVGTTSFFSFRNDGSRLPSEYSEDKPLKTVEDQKVYFTIGLLILNIAVIIILPRIVQRMYLNEATKEFIGITPGLLPKMKTVFRFKPGDLRQQKHGILPWTQCIFKIKEGKKIILLEQCFRKPQDMNIMLGHIK